MPFTYLISRQTESLGPCVCPFIAMFAHVVASRKMQIACNQRVFRLIIMRIFFFSLARNVPSAIRKQQQKQLDPPGGFQIQIQYYGYYRPLSGPPGGCHFQLNYRALGANCGGRPASSLVLQHC